MSASTAGGGRKTSILVFQGGVRVLVMQNRMLCSTREMAKDLTQTIILVVSNLNQRSLQKSQCNSIGRVAFL